MEWVPSLRHTQHACSPTVAGNAKSHYLCCPSYPSSFPLFFPLYTPHAVKSQDFSPPFCLLYPFKFKYFLQLLLFFFLLWQKSSSLNWLLLAPMATTLPLHLPLSFNPHQSFPKFQLTPLTPWLPFLLTWSSTDLNIIFSLIMWPLLTFMPPRSFVSARLMKVDKLSFLDLSSSILRLRLILNQFCML